ncbi:hypothetical protein AAC387_Pa08g1434 [Persea americana]
MDICRKRTVLASFSHGVTCNLTGITLKNFLNRKSFGRKEQLIQNWLEIDSVTKSEIKYLLFEDKLEFLFD